MKARRWVAAALLLALVAASCSGDRADDDAAPVVSVAPADSAPTTTPSTMPSTTAAAPTTTAASSTTTTTEPHLTDEEQIDALIEEYWQVVFAANNPPDPDYAGWDDVATPELAAGRRARSAENLRDNRGIAPLDPEEPFNLGSRVTVLGPRAIIFHCFRDFAYAYALDSGVITEEVSVVSVERMEARLTESGWRIDSARWLSGFDRGQEAECGESLALL